MLLFLEHTFLLLSHPSFTTKVFPAFLRCCRHPAAANPVGEDISGVLVTPSDLGGKLPRSCGTIKRWIGEIILYFDNRRTQGAVEGISNKLKLIKRREYGFRNFDNFKIRSMLSWHFNI